MEYELQTDVINLSVSLEFILSSANSRVAKNFNGRGVPPRVSLGVHCQDFQWGVMTGGERLGVALRELSN